MKNLTAMRATIKALGVDKPEHRALVAAAVNLATSMDDEPGNASLWREYRAVLADVMAVGSAGGLDDDLAKLLVEMRSQVGDASNS